MTVPVIDGHNDVLQRVCSTAEGHPFDFFGSNTDGHLDWTRARAGGMAAGFFAIFVPNPEPEAEAQQAGGGYEVPLAPALDRGYAASVAAKMAAALLDLERGAGGRLRVVREVGALRACVEGAGAALGAIMHLEGADGIDVDLVELHRLHELGLRSLGITWSRPNAFGHGVPFAFPRSPDTGPGLTEAGRRLVTECNWLGILIDLSHLNLAGFWDVASITAAPLVASHSNAHALCAATRNLLDAQLDAIAASRGVVGINFATSFLRADGERVSATSINEIARHASYLVDRVGVDHVALGSDFDGCQVPDEVQDVSGLQRVLDALRKAGFADSEVRKIAHENWLRVLEETWHPA